MREIGRSDIKLVSKNKGGGIKEGRNRKGTEDCKGKAEGRMAQRMGEDKKARGMEQNSKGSGRRMARGRVNRQQRDVRRLVERE